ncbi:MAG: Flp pilus assembly complex ATPase component TadA [Phycisphaeraceae bacterium]|nr:Flp pilus assembly complex ATPase component TadA [Phycisphaeraceae bacterium]
MMQPMLAEGFFLVSFWKPLFLLVPLVGWLWIISRVYDKHAARFHLGRGKWNAIHLSIGVLAVFAALAIPVKGEAAFWIGLGVMIVILAIDLVAYAVVANKDDRVPEEFHVKFNMLAKMAETRAAKAEAKKQGKVELVIKSPDKSTLAAPMAETPEFEVRVAAEGIVTKALDVRASQADIGPSGKDTNYAVSYLVDGVRQPGQTIPGPNAIKIMDFWKSAGKLDLQDRRRKLTADVSIERGVDKHTLRVTSSGAQGGMRMTMLFDPSKAVNKKIAELGLLEPQMAELKAIVEDAKGVVLLAAPPDMGRTTSLYSIIRMHDAYTTNVQTVELETQVALEGIRQNVFESAGEGPEFSTFTRSILRRDPQVVGVAELPDDQTAKEIARADHERTRTYLSLKTDNALSAILIWMKAVGDPDMASKSLHGVVAQKLLRKLCVNCRQPYQASPDMLKKLGVPSDKPRQLFKKGGQVLIKNKPEVCPVCNGIGYLGQDGIFEVFRIDKAEREFIKTGNMSALRAEFRKRGLPTIQQAALKKAFEGITSVEELSRVTMEQKPAAPAAKPAAATAPKPAPPKQPAPKA